MQLRRSGDGSKQDVEREDKFVSVVIGRSGIIKKGLDQNLQFISGHPSAKRATEDDTNEPCTHHW
jgi:hypothetical protein